MIRPINKINKRFRKMDGGQVLVIVALSMVVLIAIMGLALDVGTIFIDNARLRRAVDAAALAAALQIREGYNPANLEPAAKDFLNLNRIHWTSIDVVYCDLVTNTPADLCSSTGGLPRKLVRVYVEADAYLNFLAVLGINQVQISATATSETASIDMVLVIDRSESMTYNYAVGQVNADGKQMRDPSVCNDPAIHSPQGYPGDCEPFNTVKDSAIKFVNRFMFEPYDRVAVVTFDKDPHMNLHFTTDKTDVITTIENLTVYPGEGVYDSGGGNPSRLYAANGDYLGLQCPFAFHPAVPGDTNNPSPCTTTNIGGALLDAGNEFSAPHPGEVVRQNSLWVVVLLTDGVANAGYGGDPQQYYCPDGTWFGQGTVPFLCNDAIGATRHTYTDPPINYDAEDFAYDKADFVGTPLNPAIIGQNAYIYTIGLGPQVTLRSRVDCSSKDINGNCLIDDGTKLGEKFLKYAAQVGRGIYYPAPTTAELDVIFQSIANNIATILTK
jgi:Flp pilus assembly protein TadG